MPTAYIYRGTFEVRAGETLRYVEVAPDGTISPEVTRTYAELAGSGSIAAASVSLTPTVAAPTLTGVQIGAIEGVSVSLQPTVSPAAVTGVQAGSVAAAAVSMQPTVTAPSVTGVTVGSINAAAVSLQPSVATGEFTGVVAQTGSISAAAVTCQPVVAVGTLTGVEEQGGQAITETFEPAGTTFPYTGDAGVWTKTGYVTLSTASQHSGSRSLQLSANGQTSTVSITRESAAGGVLDFWSAHAGLSGMFSLKINTVQVYSRTTITGGWLHVEGITYPAGSNVFTFSLSEDTGEESNFANIDDVTWSES